MVRLLLLPALLVACGDTDAPSDAGIGPNTEAPADKEATAVDETAAQECNQAADLPSTPLQALWSQYVASDDHHTVEARWVLTGTGQTCADWTIVDGTNTATGAERKADPAPANFDITVCAATIPSSWAKATLQHGGTDQGTVYGYAQTLAATAMGKPVINLGDTGCRGYSDKDSECQQTCDDTSWGLEGVLSTAAAEAPGAYLHVGDYRYRGEEDDRPDSWKDWYDDFFVKVNAHGQGAPWILARGNHEQCSPETPTNGPGWWLLLGPDARTTCAPAGEPDAPTLHQTWAVDIPVGATTHRTVVIDTSDHSIDKKKDTAHELEDRFTDALNLRQSGPHYTRFLHHHPVLSLLSYEMPTPGDSDTRDAFAAALGKAGTGPLCTGGRCNPQADIVGHEHFYELVEFRAKGGGTEDVWADSLVVGHGGVILRDSGTAENVCKTVLTVNQADADGSFAAIIDSAKVSEHSEAFGYVSTVLASDGTSTDGWTLTPVFTGADKPTFGDSTPSCTEPDGAPMVWKAKVAAGGDLGFPTGS